MSLINIQGSNILVDSVEIYGSGIKQTTAQTSGIKPPITVGIYSTYTNFITGSAAVNPSLITSLNGYGGGGIAYIVSLAFAIEATNSLTPLAAACSLTITSTTIGLEQLSVGISTNQTIINEGLSGSIPYRWSDTITFLYYPAGSIFDLNTINFGLTAIGYDPAETFECVYTFNSIQLAN
jgi:hypothetical protein